MTSTLPYTFLKGENLMKYWVSSLLMLLGMTVYAADREINLAPGTSAILEVNIPTRVTCSSEELPICSVARHADTAVIVKIGNDQWGYYSDGETVEDNYEAAVKEIKKLRRDGLCR